MNMVDQDRVLAPNWGWFRRIWMVVAVALFLLLVLLAVLGFAPGGRHCPAGACGSGASPVALPVAGDGIDVRAPELSLRGDNPVFLKPGEPYVEPGVVALDTIDGDVAVGSSGVVDEATPGRYTLTYTATDQAGNSATLTRQVIVEAPEPIIPAAAPGAALVASLPQARLYFALGLAELPADALQTLSPVIEHLSASPEAGVVISGFHDASGNAQVNEVLAKARAEAVRDLLVGAGIDVGRIELEKPHLTEGSGNADEARRVEVRVRR